MSGEVVTSLRADAIVAKAEECFSLGLIKASTLKYVTERAYSNPEYDPIIDLPLSHVIEEERERRREMERRTRRTHRLLRLRRLVHRL